MRLGIRPILFACAAVLAACSDPGVEEHLICSLAADGSSQVEVTVTLPGPLPNDADEVLVDEIATQRQAYAGGWDRWTSHFERIEADEETFSWKREQGLLRSVTRTAGFADPAGLQAFFSETDLVVQFTPDQAESVFSIFPLPSSRATRDERERLEMLVEVWAAAVVQYLREVADLYAYLESDPDRATPIFTAIFDDEGDVTEGEEERLERLVDAFVTIMESAERSPEEPSSLEQLVRLAYDPFPARLRVVVEGRVRSVRGFVKVDSDTYEAPPLSLEQALTTLEEIWITPPLLTTYEMLERDEEAELDVEGFAALPRRVSELPDANEVRDALEAALTPPEEYRLTWRPTGLDAFGAGETP